MLRQAPTIDLTPRRKIPWRTIGLVAGCVLLLALLGFVAGRLSHSDEPPPAGLIKGPISVRFDDGDWEQAVPPATPGLTLLAPVGLRSRHDDRPGTVVLGLAPDAQGVGLLPRELAASLRGRVPVQRVRVGPYTGLYYEALPATSVDSELDLLLVPTPRGAATVVCLTPRVLSPGTEPADCRAVAATLKLNGLRALPLATGGAYGDALASTLARLDGRAAGAPPPARRRADAAGATARRGRSRRGLRGRRERHGRDRADPLRAALPRRAPQRTPTRHATLRDARRRGRRG